MSGTTTTTVPYLIPASTGEVLVYGMIDPAQLATTSGAVQITPAQYATLLAGGRYFWAYNTLTAIAGAAPLAEAQAAATTSVDVAAEACRLLFMTPGSGQSMVYAAKAQEATAFLAKYPTQDAQNAASPAIVGTDWPFMNAEVGITGPDWFTVATVVSGLQDEWTGIAATIEHLRLGAKQAIAAATTVTAINAALVIAWPTVTAP